MYRYFFISLFVLMSIISKAEVTLQSTLLSNSEWEIIYPIDDSIVHRWKFSSSEIGVSDIYKGRKSHELKYSYYLSKSNTESFDNSKVGKYSSGCYLYEYNRINKAVTIWKIISFDKINKILTVSCETQAENKPIAVGRKTVILRLKRL